MASHNASTDGRNSALFDRFDRSSTFILSNLVWVVFAIPVFTLPLGTVGLFQVMSLWARGKQPEFFKDFFDAIRRRWWKALLVGLIDFVVGTLVYANMMILNMMEFDNPLALVGRGTTVLVALVLLMTNMYIWSLLVIAEFSLRRIMWLSFKLVFAHPFETVGTLIAGLLPLAIGLLLALPALFWLLGLVSLSTLIINWGTWRVIRRYVPEAELMEYESRI